MNTPVLIVLIGLIVAIAVVGGIRLYTHLTYQPPETKRKWTDPSSSDKRRF